MPSAHIHGREACHEAPRVDAITVIVHGTVGENVSFGRGRVQRAPIVAPI